MRVFEGYRTERSNQGLIAAPYKKRDLKAPFLYGRERVSQSKAYVRLPTSENAR